MTPTLFPTDRWTRLLLAPALVFIATIVDRNYQTDLWHHLARGRAIVTEGRLLDEDRFTYTVHGQPLQDVNWLWQALFYRLHMLGGLPLVQTANSFILAVMMALLVMHAWRRSGSLIAASAICIFAFFGLWQLLIIRPQTLSLLLFVLLHGFLDQAERRRGLLIVPPLIMAIWVNVHGGFPIGLVLIGGYIGSRMAEQWWTGAERPRGDLARLLLCFVASVAATLANPYGWRVYEYVVRTSRAASGRHIDEWLPPSLDLLTGKIWACSLLLLLIGLTLAPRRPRLREIGLLCCFLPFACGSVRMAAWWLLICVPLLSALISELSPRLRRLDQGDDRPTFANALVCAALVLVMILSLPWLEAYNPTFARPERAHRIETDLQQLADQLRAEGRGGRIFTRFAWGEYFGWCLSPEYTVFMDGRIEIIPNEVWHQYEAVTRGRTDWQAILDHYKVDCLVLDVSGYHHDLLPLVQQSRSWRQVCRRGDALLFVRTSASSLTDRAAPSPECQSGHAARSAGR